MFPYMQIFVVSKLILAVFDLYVAQRQHKRYHPKHSPSRRVAAIVSPQKFREAQAYCRAKSSFQITVAVIEGLLETTMTLTFVFPKIWFFAGKYAGNSELLQTQLFALLSGAIMLLLGLPSSIYNTFVLEAKYGFNRTTVKTFALDIAKEAMLSGVIGLLLLSALYYVLLYFSSYSAITIAFGLWLLISVITVMMMIIYPSVIAPLFNTFNPLTEGQLKQKLTALAKKLNFPLDKMYIIDGSRRSSHSNAYIFGLFKKYICIYDSLLEQMKGNDNQVVSILCHELGHWRHSHLVRGVLISLVEVFIFCILYGFTAGKPDLFLSFGYTDGMPLVIGLMLFNALSSPIDTLLTPVQNMLSRHFEYQADLFAKEQGMAEDLGQALISISVSNLSNMSPDPLYSAWNYSHPTLVERLDALNADTASNKED